MSDPRDEPEAMLKRCMEESADLHEVIDRLREQLHTMRAYCDAIEHERDTLIRQNDRLRAAGKEV